MSTENTNTPADTNDDNLDTFSDELFGRSKPEAEASTSDVEDDAELEADANEEDTQTVEDDDTLAPDEDDDEEAEESEDPKPKKNRFQERIDEVVSKQRDAERKLQEALDKLQALEQGKKTDPEPAKLVAVTDPATGPMPDALNEDGTEKYPLGEFDPNYIKDLTIHTFQQARADEQQAELVKQQEKEDAAAQAAITAEWQEKLGPAKERYPDFQEKGEQLFGTFEAIDQKYGEYLAATLMSLEYGPDVLYYLSNNLDEADRIVKSGPAKAAIALGRLEAQFVVSGEEKQIPRTRVTKAPAPPGQLNRGTAVSKTVKGDEDDLESFAYSFFKKK